MRYSMLNVREVIRMCIPYGEDEARDLEVGKLFGECDEVVIASKDLAKSDTAEVEEAILNMQDLERGDTHIRFG